MKPRMKTKRKLLQILPHNLRKNMLLRKYAVKKVNAKGLAVLRNGVVSMRNLELCEERPTKSRDPDACKLFDASLTFSKAFQLFSLVQIGKKSSSGDSQEPGCTSVADAFRSKVSHERGES
jgi:hypothetical protein